MHITQSRNSRLLGPLTLILALAGSPALAQTSAAPTLPRSGAAVRVDAGPVIDGRLNETVWTQAEPLTDFVQHEPVAGAPATERTDVRVIFDNEALYVGAGCTTARPIASSRANAGATPRSRSRMPS